MLLQAEKGTLQTARAAVHPEAVLDAVVGIIEGHPDALFKAMMAADNDHVGSLRSVLAKSP